MWQPIETAPKDGTELLLIVIGYKPVVGYFDEERQEWDYQTRSDFIETEHWLDWLEHTGTWEPTHWVPLPPPPTE